jgi:NAD(P)H-hydrate epimerase
MNMRESSDEDIAAACRPRRLNSRKGENGVVMVVGGSWLYHGAPLLSALAALRSGVDLVYLVVPERISTALRAYTPSIIVMPITDYKLTPKMVRRVVDKITGVNAIVVGPGLSRGSEKGIRHLLEHAMNSKIKSVLDATALFPEVLQTVQGSGFIITPHAGEYRRVFGYELPAPLETRAEKVMLEASEHGLTILLKGVVDVISDGATVVLNRKSWEAAGMTVGGTGDVLAGLAAGLMARGATSFEAAVAAARVNGLAGVNAVKQKGFHITPEDVIEQFPHVLKPYDRVVG